MAILLNDAGDRVAYVTPSNWAGAQGAVFLRFYPLWNYNDGVAHALLGAGDAEANHFIVFKHTDNQLYAGFTAGGTYYRITSGTVAAAIRPMMWNTLWYWWDDAAAGDKHHVLVNAVQGNRATATRPDLTGKPLVVGAPGQALTAYDPDSRFVDAAIWSTPPDAAARSAINAGALPSDYATGLVFYAPLTDSLTLDDTIAALTGTGTNVLDANGPSATDIETNLTQVAVRTRTGGSVASGVTQMVVRTRTVTWAPSTVTQVSVRTRTLVPPKGGSYVFMGDGGGGLWTE